METNNRHSELMFSQLDQKMKHVCQWHKIHKETKIPLTDVCTIETNEQAKLISIYNFLHEKQEYRQFRCTCAPLWKDGFSKRNEIMKDNKSKLRSNLVWDINSASMTTIY